jgi:integral membrane protein (TIGR01906 family)
VVATVLLLVAVSVLPLLTPLFVHVALDAASSARLLDVDAAVARQLSDRSVDELVFGPGAFDFEGPDGEPFYDDAERGHLRDARALLWLGLVGGVGSAAVLTLLVARAGARSSRTWRAISRAGAVVAIGVVLIGIGGLVAFESLFTLFHRVFFPAGGWAFDPTTQRLVQLYPVVFWQVTAAAFGALLLVLGALTWWVGRALARRADDEDPSDAAAKRVRGR